MRRNIQPSANKMVPEENVSHRTIQVILNEAWDLIFIRKKKKKIQGLTKS